MERVYLTEVGPRDGLQNETVLISTEDKLSFILALVAAGHRDIEVSSFVNPKKIPQLADAKALFDALSRNSASTNCLLSALVPNMQGLEAALAVGVKKIAVFTAASNTFTQHNIHATVLESFARFEPVLARAKASQLKTRGYISTAFSCPYEGDIAPQAVLDVANRFMDLGVDELSIGDTIGAATPKDIEAVFTALLSAIPAQQLVLHCHDTYGTALANILQGLTMGLRRFDSSSGGLGGCPYAPGASGNIATEDLVYTLQRMGFETGIDLDLQLKASKTIEPFLSKALSSRVFQAKATL
jgi:hydroxymethylglutaryl-CoA lyase